MAAEVTGAAWVSVVGGVVELLQRQAGGIPKEGIQDGEVWLLCANAKLSIRLVLSEAGLPSGDVDWQEGSISPSV